MLKCHFFLVPLHSKITDVRQPVGLTRTILFMRGAAHVVTRFFKTINEQRDIYDWRQSGSRISDGCRF